MKKMSRSPRHKRRLEESHHRRERSSSPKEKKRSRRQEREDSPVRRHNRKDSPVRRHGREDSPVRRRGREDSPVRRRDREDSSVRKYDREDSPFKGHESEDSPIRRQQREDSPIRRREREDSSVRRREKVFQDRKQERENIPFRRREREASPVRRHDKDTSSFKRGEREGSPNRRTEREERRHEIECSPVYKQHRYDTEEGKKAASKSRRREETPSPPPLTQPKTIANDLPLSKIKMQAVNMRTGGAYIPPAKLKMMQDQITDKGSIEYQRIAWEALKKSLTGLTNKINMSNIGDVVRELFKENVIRGRGVLARAIMQAQAMSPTFTHVYAALVAIINSKFPKVGELILKRLIIQFKRSFRRNDKQVCVPTIRFIGHLLNQGVAFEVLVLEILLVLLETPTNDSVEIAIALLKECGMKLTELSGRGIAAIFERLRHLSHDNSIDKRVKYMMDVISQIRKDGFKDHPAVLQELDLVEEGEKNTHQLALDDSIDPEDILNVFKFDPEYLVNEQRYKDIERELLGESESEDESGGSSGSDDESEKEDEEKDNNEEQQKIHDMTETNLVALRRNIYLTIQSSLDFEECAHKLLKLELNPGQIVEMCYMILDCCAQQRTYEKFFGLLAQRFCQLNKIYIEPFTDIFKISYETIHRFETNKLRNVAKFFAHLLFTDAISWMVLSCIKLNEDDTTSSSRIFIKILFQELCEYMGLTKLNDRVKDVTLQEAFDGLFPRDNPKNTRFAINFFTSIGLGGLTDELREHLKSAPKPAPPPPVASLPEVEDSSSSSSSENSSDSEDDSSEDDSKSKKRKRKSSHHKKSKKKKQKKKSSKKHKRSKKH